MRRALAALAVVALVAGCDRDVPRVQRQTKRNPPSIGFIDAPAANAVVGPMFSVAGWALDESHVKEVRVFLDDELVASLALTVLRPDVEKQFPPRVGVGTPHGFSTLVDAGSRKGYCTIRFEALDGHGALTQFATTTVKIEP